MLFGRLGEIAAEYLKKGSQVYIEGSLRTRKWQDKQGNDRYSTEIVANDMQMLGGRGGGGGGGGGEAGERRRAARIPARPGLPSDSRARRRRRRRTRLAPAARISTTTSRSELLVSRGRAEESAAHFGRLDF